MELQFNEKKRKPLASSWDMSYDGDGWMEQQNILCIYEQEENSYE